jgi:hypothetical protein
MRGWTIDYGEVREAFTPVFRELDHHALNESTGTDGDLPALLGWMRERVAPRCRRWIASISTPRRTRRDPALGRGGAGAAGAGAMSYAVKEIFYTLQGEGANAGRPAVFCRFAGCNLWSGREKHRATAVCRSATPTSSAPTAPAAALRRCAGAGATHRRAVAARGTSRARPLVVFTGGEPLLQLDAALIDAVHALGMEIAVETNGTRPAPRVSTGCASRPRPARPSCSWQATS